jgi:hypothetical protein
MVLMDDEGAELMKAGMEMAHHALRARRDRVDPDKILSRSYGMSAVKTADVLRQLDEPPLAEFSQLEAREKITAVKLCEAMAAAEDMEMRDVIWRKIRGFALRRLGREATLIEAAVTGRAEKAGMGVQKAPARKKTKKTDV